MGVKDWWVFPGFEIEHMVGGLDLPVNIAFVPELRKERDAPLLYVTELYGQIKVITNNWNVRTYADNLLNYKGDHQFPGTGESGVIGICVEPGGDLFVTMLYADKDEIKAKLVRMTSKDGLKMGSMKTIIDNIPSTTRSHQIQDVTIGYDGKLYVNIGDGGEHEKAPQDDNDLRGKILRMNLDGSVPDDNPKPGSLVFAKGMRNPFGAAWRKSDKSLYVSINGPDVDDVVAKVTAGGNHGWYPDMRKNALFVWHFTQAPTAMDFMQNGEFPEQFNDELFVALFGNAYWKGWDIKGKKIVKMRINKDGTGVVSYDEFVTYIGQGPGSPCGLAFGPDGMYFTDLHEGNIYRIKPNAK